MTPNAQRTQRLRELISQGPVMMPGAINALSAKLIQQTGFDAMYLSGAVLSNSVVGVPDVGMVTLTEARDHAAHCAEHTSLPILMDADTGFGEGPFNIARTIKTLYHAGVSAVHVEDQVFPKRCGHLDGKELVDKSEFCEKLTAASEAKPDPNFVLLARTDARGVEGYDAAVDRAQAYLKAGADGIFIEALQSQEEFARFAKDVDTILLANMTEFGKTPYLSADEFGDMGYDIVIYPVTLQRIAMFAMREALGVLKEKRTQKSLLDSMQTRQELYDLLEYDMTSPVKDERDK